MGARDIDEMDHTAEEFRRVAEWQQRQDHAEAVDRHLAALDANLAKLPTAAAFTITVDLLRSPYDVLVAAGEMIHQQIVKRDKAVEEAMA